MTAPGLSPRMRYSSVRGLLVRLHPSVVVDSRLSAALPFCLFFFLPISSFDRRFCCALRACSPPNTPFSRCVSVCRAKEARKGSGGETVVTYFFCGEEIPYRRNMKSHCLTLGHFKEQLRKKGSYRCVCVCV